MADPLSDRSGTPVIVSFEVEPGQVWIDPHEVAWYVKLIDGNIVHLERTVVEHRHVRDLVRTCRQPNDRAALDDTQAERQDT